MKRERALMVASVAAVLSAVGDCGYACHTIVKKNDYVFTAYPKR